MLAMDRTTHEEICNRWNGDLLKSRFPETKKKLLETTIRDVRKASYPQGQTNQ